MPGAIVGGIVGSVYEFDNHRSKDFELLRSERHLDSLRKGEGP